MVSKRIEFKNFGLLKDDRINTIRVIPNMYIIGTGPEPDMNDNGKLMEVIGFDMYGKIICICGDTITTVDPNKNLVYVEN